MSDSNFTMNFAQAFNALKLGKKVTREPWAAGGVYLYQATCHLTLPQNDPQAKDESTFIIMRTGDGDLIPWFMNQNDVAISDWAIVE